eukprot:359869-Chlamydomonas_euryale.AAC.17
MARRMCVCVCVCPDGRASASVGACERALTSPDPAQLFARARFMPTLTVAMSSVLRMPSSSSSSCLNASPATRAHSSGSLFCSAFQSSCDAANAARPMLPVLPTSSCSSRRAISDASSLKPMVLSLRAKRAGQCLYIQSAPCEAHAWGKNVCGHQAVRRRLEHESARCTGWMDGRVSVRLGCRVHEWGPTENPKLAHTCMRARARMDTRVLPTCLPGRRCRCSGSAGRPPHRAAPAAPTSGRTRGRGMPRRRHPRCMGCRRPPAPSAGPARCPAARPSAARRPGQTSGCAAPRSAAAGGPGNGRSRRP